MNNFSLLSLPSCSSLEYSVEFVVTKNALPSSSYKLLTVQVTRRKISFVSECFLKKLNNYKWFKPKLFWKNIPIFAEAVSLLSQLRK